MVSGSGLPGVRLSEEDHDFAEKDPTGRYVRYDEILGKGAFKTVYRAFDEVNGIEVAWNLVNIEDLLQTPGQLERLYSEVNLLKSLKHDNIIKLYNSWVDDTDKTVNMITELFTSGSLRTYRRKHKKVDIKAIKNWARQILRGLHYLHSHDPPVIHRDLKCDNIFVNGNTGEIKIGDLGLATVMRQPTARSVIGTPEFMAPELYEEEYNELVDIYSFGMCILEMVTCDYPYSECRNPAQIYKKVISGIKPLSLSKVSDPQIREFIEKCLVLASRRLPAAELLKDPFLACETQQESASCSSQLLNSIESTDSVPDPLPMDIDTNFKKPSFGSSVKGIHESPRVSTLEFQRFTESHAFTLRGGKNEDETISMTLRVAEQSGQARNIHFTFYLDTDTAISIAQEMVDQFDLLAEDADVIAALIDELIMELVPSWIPSSGESPSVYASAKISAATTVNEEHIELHFGTTKDQETQESVNSDISAEYYFASASNTSSEQPRGFADTCLHEETKGFNAITAGLYLGGCVPDEHEEIMNSDNIVESILLNEPVGNSQSSYMGSCTAMSKGMSFSSIGSLSLADKGKVDDELKLEIDAIHSKYQQRLQELFRQREEAIQVAKTKWMAKKSSSSVDA